MATSEHELDPLRVSLPEMLISLGVIVIPIAVLVVIFLLLRARSRGNETDAAG